MIQGKLKLTTVEGDGRRFTAESGSGHTIVLDDSHGNTGQRPIEAVLLALGGCTAFDVIGILRKMRQRVTGYEVTLEAEQKDNPPKCFTHVVIKHHLRGEINPDAVRKAINLSESKYCSVGAMIGKSAEIEHTFEITPEDQHEESKEGADEAVLHRSSGN
jgi:putative redox protein